MKLLFVITGLGLGGAEKQLISLADTFSRRGDEVAIIYLSGRADVAPTCPTVKVVGLDMKNSIVGFCRGYFKLRQIIREFKPDVVHSHMVHANLLARLVRISIKVPRLVCTAHNTNEGGRLRMLGYRLTDRFADISTNVSCEAVEAFEEKGAVPQGRMLAVLNGIDPDIFYNDPVSRLAVRKAAGVESEDKLILAVGRLAPEKDYPNLLHAFSNIRRTETKTWLWIAGGGKLLHVLERLAVDLNIADRVRFLGSRSDIPALYNAGDVFVLSSAWEGFGLVVAEAMASEKVVVATDCGGVREVLGDCGFLVPRSNADALADRLLQALGMAGSESAIALGKRARQRVVEQYSLMKAVAIWDSIYRTAAPAHVDDMPYVGSDSK